VAHFERLFRVSPEALAYDLHPNYLATRYALERAGRENLPAVGVQHHHAHIAACMAEHGLHGEEPVIGVAFDGTGYGSDGAIWGGEFLIADYRQFERAAHLTYLPLPGGDSAVRKPARTALAALWQAGLDWEPGLPSVDAFCAEERSALRSQLEHRLNTPLTSSMGRLFDAVAALAGVRQKVNYEAQAAIELEALADPLEQGVYPFEIGPAVQEGAGFEISPTPLFQEVLADLYSAVPVQAISARFHNSVAKMVSQVCRDLRRRSGLNLNVVLSGGVWQNVTLLRKTLDLLDRDAFTVLIHTQVPANDGGIPLGQAAVAINKLEG
jgi:hydrogenase maturation protein HypF